MYIPCKENDLDIIKKNKTYGILLRNFSVSFNINVVFIKEMHSDMFFKIIDEEYKDYGDVLMCPNQLLHRKKGEKFIFYIPDWYFLFTKNKKLIKNIKNLNL